MGAVIQLGLPKAARSPRVSLAAAFKRHRLPEPLIDELMRESAAWPNLSQEDALAAVLKRRMRPQPIDFECARGLVLVGPDGAGKSAVAGKIAHMALLSGRKVEMASAADGLALFRTATFDSDSLIVMEARGFNPANRRALTAFAAMGKAEGAESIAVVSATCDAEDVLETVTALNLPRVIVTGLDRTSRLGATVAAVTAGSALAHVTYGARPDDGLESLAPALLAKMLLD